MRDRILLLCTMLLLVGICVSVASARTPRSSTTTAILVKDMHCAGCAKKVVGKLYTVPGVAGVKTSLKANTAWVTPASNQTPSPRAMWEAVEQAGQEVIMLSGPAGKYTKKPGQ